MEGDAISRISHSGWGIVIGLVSLSAAFAALGGTAWDGYRNWALALFAVACVTFVVAVIAAVLVLRERPPNLSDLLKVSGGSTQEPLPGSPTDLREILLLEVANCSDHQLENVQVRLSTVTKTLSTGLAHPLVKFAPHALLPLAEGSLPRLTPRDRLEYRVIRSDQGTRPFAYFEAVPQLPGNGLTNGAYGLSFVVSADHTRPLNQQFQMSYDATGPTLKWES